MSDISPVLFIDGDGINKRKLNKIRDDIKAELEREKIALEVPARKGPTRDMSFAGSLLLNLAAETIVKDVAKRIVEVVSEKVSQEEGLKVTFQQARSLFTGDAPEVTFDSTSVTKDKRQMVAELLSTFGVDPNIGEKKALLVGCSKYDDSSLQDLKYASKNASDFATVLANNEFSDFSKPVCQLDQSKSTVESEISKMLTTANSNDLVVLFFSGHGLLMSEKFFIACRDTKSPLAEDFAATCISISFINNMIELSKCERFVIVVDCCYAGDAGDNLRSMVFSSSNTSAINEKSIYWLFSCDKGNRTFESDIYKNSIFTKHLIEGITTSKADLNEDGEISLAELEQYIGENLANETSSNISNYPINAVSNSIIVAKNNRTLRERMHLEHAAAISDLFQQGVITTELRHDWFATSELISKLDGSSFESDADRREKWTILQHLTDQKIKPSEAIRKWYSGSNPGAGKPEKPDTRSAFWTKVASVGAIGLLGLYMITQTQQAPDNKEVLEKLQVAEEQLQTTKAELVKTKSAYDKEKITSGTLGETLFSANTEIAGLKRKVTTQTQKTEETEKKLRSEIERLKESTNKDIDNEINRLTSELASANERFSSLEKENQDLADDNRELKKLQARVSYGPSVIRNEDLRTSNKNVQVTLNKLGCYFGFIDGDMGNQTQAALTASTGSDEAARAVKDVKNKEEFSKIRRVNNKILEGSFGELRRCNLSSGHYVNYQEGNRINGFKSDDFTRIKGRFPPDRNQIHFLFKKPNNTENIRLVDSMGTIESVSVSTWRGGIRQIEFSNGKATIEVDELKNGSFTFIVQKRQEVDSVTIPTDFSIIAMLRR